MRILGIETSCDETAAAIVEDGRTIISNIIASQVEEHSIYGGVVPEIASRRHIENISEVTNKALSEANMQMPEVDAIATTFAPGLIGALLVGCNFAKSIAFSASKPFVPVHHLRGHIASLYLTNPQLQPPFLCLVASGGHSHIVLAKSYTEFETIGRTIDDAAGEAFDKVARVLNLGYPGGPAVADTAKEGNENGYKLPTPHTENPFDVSFSGLKTSVMNIVNQAEMKEEKICIPDLAASFQLKMVTILKEKLMSASQKMQVNKIALAGGVAANKLLRDMLMEECALQRKELFLPEIALCGDNAAMIASQGYFEYEAGNIGKFSQNAFATMPIHYKNLYEINE